VVEQAELAHALLDMIMCYGIVTLKSKRVVEPFSHFLPQLPYHFLNLFQSEMQCWISKISFGFAFASMHPIPT
jgi:hypothetical protein